MSGKINSIVQQDCIDLLTRIELEGLRNAGVLVTGSNGLLGKYLVHAIYFANALQGLNCKVYCASLHEPGQEIKRLLSDENIIPIQIDLSKPFSFEHPVDYVFHAACYAQPEMWLQNKLETIALNVDAVKVLLEVTKNNSARFMFFSSLDVYGDIPKERVPVPETYNGNFSTTGPRAAYGESKRLGETICSIFRNECDVDAYIVRIGHTYGPGVSVKDSRVLGDFIRMALFEKKIRMLDKGESVKTFGYITDIAYMIFKVMLEGKEFVYNVGGTDVIRIRELAEEVSRCCANVPVIEPETESKLEHIGTDPEYVGLDVSKFIHEFGNFNFMDFSEGIRRTVEWNKEEAAMELKGNK